MEIERLLRDALDLKRMDGEPSSGLEERVMRALPDRRRGRRSAYAAAFLAAAAVMALVAVLGPWYASRPSAVEGGPSASPRDTATIEPEPSATAIPPVHAHNWGLSFDYPAGWQVNDAPALPAVSSPSPPPGLRLESLYLGQVLGYVGTQMPQTNCTQAATRPLTSGGWSISHGICTSAWSLQPGDVSVRVQVGDVTGTNLLTGQLVPGTTQTTVGGLPALFERTEGAGVPNYGPDMTSPGFVTMPSDESATGADVILTWYLPGNDQLVDLNQTPTAYRITAVLRGPNTAALEAQVQAVIASMQYDPAVIQLPADPVDLAALEKTALAAALDNFDSSDPGTFSCFPRTPGSAAATITVTPQTVKLGKPLPVVCATAIEPNAMQSWTVTLTVSWSAAADRNAGTWTEVTYTTSDGRTWGNGRTWTPVTPFPYEVGSGQPG